MPVFNNKLRYLSLVDGKIYGSPNLPKKFKIAAVAVRNDGWVAIISSEALNAFQQEWYKDHEKEWSSVTILT